MKKFIVKALSTLGAFSALVSGALWWSSAQSGNLAMDHPTSNLVGPLNHIAGQFNSDAAALSALSAFCVAVAVIIDD